jgi:hypothetical protein
MTARILDIGQLEYRRGTTGSGAIPHLSQSTAHTLISQSPLHAWTFHPKLGGQQRERTDAKDNGTLIHKLLLGKGQDIAVLGVKDYRTNVAKDARDEAIAMGRLPVKEADYEVAEDGANRLRKRLIDDYGIVLDGESEVVFEWEEMGANGPVLCRGMMDHVKVSEGVIYDVKSTRSAHPKQCAASMVTYGADIQTATYVSALEKYKPELAGRIDMIFLFMELTSPYAILPARPNGMMRELGAMKWARAVKIWEKCLATDTWPGYSTDIVQLEPMPWHMTQALLDDAENENS